MKKFFLIAGAAAIGLGLTGAAMAEGWGGGKHHGMKGEGRGGQRMMQMIDANADGFIGDDEAAAMAERMFTRIDKDGNAELTIEEATTPRMKGMGGHGRKHGGGWAKWWNGDDKGGAQGNAEPGSGAQQQGNAQSPAANAPDGDDQMPPRFAMMQEHMKARFAEADADKNNVVTKLEFMNAAKARFVTADADKDGKVTPWEFRSQQKM